MRPKPVRPRAFEGLAAFTRRCEQALEQHGPEASVIFGSRRMRRRSWLQFAPQVRATVLGWDAEARLSLCEVGARAALEAVRSGHFVDPSPAP